MADCNLEKPQTLSEPVFFIKSLLQIAFNIQGRNDLTSLTWNAEVRTKSLLEGYRSVVWSFITSF